MEERDCRPDQTRPDRAAALFPNMMEQALGRFCRSRSQSPKELRNRFLSEPSPALIKVRGLYVVQPLYHAT